MHYIFIAQVNFNLESLSFNPPSLFNHIDSFVYFMHSKYFICSLNIVHLKNHANKALLTATMNMKTK